MKTHQWYCGVGGEQYGPFSWDQMRAMAKEGRIVGETYVRRDIDEQWFPAARVSGLLRQESPGSRGRGGALTGNRSAAADSGPPAAAQATGTSRLRSKASRQATPAPRDVDSPPVIVVTFNVGPARGQQSQDGSPPDPQRKRRMIMVTVAAGGVLLLSAAGVGVLLWTLARARSVAESRLEAALDAATAELAAGVAEGESDPLLTAARDAVAEMVPGQAGPRERAEAARLVSAQASWLSIARVRAITLDKMRFQISRVWLAADAQGLPASLEPLADAGTRPLATASDGRYVFVELQITNTASVPRRYAGWNTSPLAAVLADQDYSVLPLVSARETPSVARLTGQSVAAGQSITDVLVFAAPQNAVAALHLLLEKQRLAEGARGHFALEIPLEVLLDARPDGSNRGVSAPASESSGAAPAKPPPAGQAKADGSPPSRDELERQIQDVLKREEMAAKKNAAMEKSAAEE